MMTNRTKRQAMRDNGAATIWSLVKLAGLHTCVGYCPSSLKPIAAFGVLGNRLEQAEVGLISDQRQMHL